MMDMNTIIANNISKTLKKNGKKQTDLAEKMGYSKQVISNMLSGSRSINAIELKQISEFCNVSMEELVTLPERPIETNVVRIFMGIAKTDEARQGIEFADKLIDMYLFHANVQEANIIGSTEWSSL